jgi:hypothetical protein
LTQRDYCEVFLFQVQQIGVARYEAIRAGGTSQREEVIVMASPDPNFENDDDAFVCQCRASRSHRTYSKYSSYVWYSQNIFFD